MVNTQKRTTFVMAALSVVFLGMAFPVGVSAQGVADAPIAFKNLTDRAMKIEVVSLLRRDGKQIPVNATWSFAPHYAAPAAGPYPTEETPRPGGTIFYSLVALLAPEAWLLRG